MKSVSGHLKGQEFHLHPARAALVTHATEYGELKLQRHESVLVFRLGFRVRVRVGVF